MRWWAGKAEEGGDEGDADPGQRLRLRFVRQLLGELWGWFGDDEPGDEAAEQRTGDDRGRQAHDQPVENGLADVGAEDAGRQQWARVRRHEPVHHREAGEQRDGDLDQRHVHPPRHDEDERDQQHEADFEEQRNADEKATNIIAQCTRSLPNAPSSAFAI